MKLLKLRHIPDFKFDIYLPCNEGRGGRSIGADPLLQYFGKKIENGVTWCRLQLWCFCFCLCQEEVAQAEARPDTCVSQHRREALLHSIFIFNTTEWVSLTPTFLSLSFGKMAWDLHLSFCQKLKALYLQETVFLQKLLPVSLIYCVKKICILLTLEEPSSSSIQL